VKLVLFDIDGTLLWSDGAGRHAMTGALHQTFGGAGSTSYRYDGKTDPQIVHDLMLAEGHSAEAIAARMPMLMERYLTRLREAFAGGMRAHTMNGVPELLDSLEARSDAVVGLLTGNLADGAAVKLRAAGLDPARFRVGAFGSDHRHRPELPSIAQQRALDQLGLDIPGPSVVVIGDTPADVECGRGIGARAIGVATGRYSTDELSQAGAYAVFPTLADTAAVMRAIMDV
jgi:phosphoglycolate phosphatase-like HAD superfamily hydrolase